MDWFKKHTDSVVVLGGILASVMWMNGKFNELKTEITVVKTVLIMKGIFPSDLAKNFKKEGEEK